MIGLEALTQPITEQSDQTRKLIFNNSFLLVSSVFEPFFGSAVCVQNGVQSCALGTVSTFCTPCQCKEKCKVQNAGIHPFGSVPLIYYHQAPTSGDYTAILNLFGYWATFSLCRTRVTTNFPHTSILLLEMRLCMCTVQIWMFCHEILYDLKGGVLMWWLLFIASLTCVPVESSPSLVYKILQIACILALDCKVGFFEEVRQGSLSVPV